MNKEIEELKKEIGEGIIITKSGERIPTISSQLFEEKLQGFIKGKLSQLKDEKEFLENDIDGVNSCLTDYNIKNRLSKINKEIKELEKVDLKEKIA